MSMNVLDVLIVDDDLILARTLVRILTARGHTCRTAPTVAAALQAIEEQAPGLLLTDWNLGPGPSGVELVARLRRGWPGIAALMMTGNEPALARAALVAAGLDEVAVLGKPFALDVLLARLDELGGGRSPRLAGGSARTTPLALRAERLGG
jgi:DNA-binding response OmpR family regulator